MRAPEESLCEDCPPVGYPTDKTRCTPCPRRSPKLNEVDDDELDVLVIGAWEQVHE
jgi:hypothetical protein